MNNDLEKKIEAILFYKAEPVSLRELARLSDVSISAVSEAIDSLTHSLKERGLTIIKNNEEIMLGTSPEVSDTIKRIAKEELERDPGKSGLETLAIIAYRGPITRADIDYIRGVNSSYVLRNLLIRGLILREINPDNQRSFIYKPTTELFSYIGVTKKEELPEFEDFEKELEKKLRDATL